MGVYIDRDELLELYANTDDLDISDYDVKVAVIRQNILDMPTIDIVRCGECKYMRKYALRSDEPTGIWCHRWSVPRLVTGDDFCSYGERKK